MINTSGTFFTETLESIKKNLKLDLTAESETISNASNITRKIVEAYETQVAKGHVGKAGKGIPKNFRRSGVGPGGLVYGRIQSGKTRAMITSTAMAFDNGFRIVLVMTSNINDLVSQTHLDFSRDLVGVQVFTKDDELDEQEEKAKLELDSDEGRILIITSKGNKSLKNVHDFLVSINAQKYPMLVFDDEGDQASLDTNTYKRSVSGDLTLAKSQINNLIARIRNDFSACIYVSVTGTPQAVLLQAASSDNRPSFIHMLPPGRGYVGGSEFFATPEPQDNLEHLVSIVPNEDKSHLLDPNEKFPDGLRDSILFFLLAAAAARQNLGMPENGKGYQFLCHPSLINNEQNQAKKRIHDYLNDIRRVLKGHDDKLEITPSLKEQYRKLQLKLGISETPALSVLLGVIDAELKREKILVINNSNTKRRGIEYGPGFNFLIGGNTLGRGIAIPNLLVTYYVRQAVTSQMDTMHQHARMFGYRQKTLPYTQLFTTLTLYYRFSDIYTSDQALRNFIENHVSDPSTFPIDISIGLNPTRRGVLDVDTVEAVAPGMQLYPNLMKLPQPPKSVANVWDLLFKHFKIKNNDKNGLSQKGKTGVRISIDDANEILQSIKTKSTNSWHDSTIQDVLRKLVERLGDEVILRYRSAERTIGEGGLLSSGTLSGAEQTAGRNEKQVTMWIMDVTPKSQSGASKDPVFMFPTIVVSNSLPSVFVFSKK